ncbi:LysR family transcriptional regulator [Paraglaciecola sp. L1A13]|uniref:LysR family transcriptional regulator n=1 Tax=Paraglaciecola sp. L1A13 TaxID=2686359 RepID=UPI00131A7D77|nr:LysR family transcriptional regulator [Paraglaciecola sp. L1A13]|tara:strand:- start:3446 stop:4342 length:897 start_codon:yes stop_codon:yes gene_type:complete
MRLRQIEVFHAIYTTGSITNAANLLYVSQPSVSKVLAHAELQLGFMLFNRTKGKLIPTTEANLLFKEVDIIYKQLNSIKKMSANIKQSEHGLIEIAVTPALGFQIIPNTLAKFKAKHANVSIKFKTMHNDEALQSLLEHKCDAAILYASPSLPSVKEVRLGKSEMVVCYPNAVFSEQPKTLTLEALANQELIGIWDSGPLGALVWERLIANDIQINSTYQVDTYYIATKFVDKNLGCCTVDYYTAYGNQTENFSIASLSPPIEFDIKALYLESRPLSRICSTFLQYVKQEMTDSVIAP